MIQELELILCKKELSKAQEQLVQRTDFFLLYFQCLIELSANAYERLTVLCVKQSYTQELQHSCKIKRSFFKYIIMSHVNGYLLLILN